MKATSLIAVFGFRSLASFALFFHFIFFSYLSVTVICPQRKEGVFISRWTRMCVRVCLCVCACGLVCQGHWWHSMVTFCLAIWLRLCPRLSYVCCFLAIGFEAHLQNSVNKQAHRHWNTCTERKNARHLLIKSLDTLPSFSFSALL